MFLSESAKKVLLVIRGDNLAKSMSSYLSRRVETKDNIEILRTTEIRKMTGRRFLEAVEVEKHPDPRAPSHPGLRRLFNDRSQAVHHLAATRNRARREGLH